MAQAQGEGEIMDEKKPGDGITRLFGLGEYLLD